MPRFAEVVIACFGLLVSLPVLLVAAVAIKMTSRGPTLFRQARVGLGGYPFTLFKLRTMKMERRGTQVTAKGDVRVTPIGRLLRFLKIDELPGLWNVIRGDMGLVGPRPEVPEFVDSSDPRWRRVLQVRPGLTDPVTLRLRNEEELMASVAEDHESFYRDTLLPYKLRGYSTYLDERTWMTDLRVLWQTLVAVVKP